MIKSFVVTKRDGTKVFVYASDYQKVVDGALITVTHEDQVKISVPDFTTIEEETPEQLQAREAAQAAAQEAAKALQDELKNVIKATLADPQATSDQKLNALVQHLGLSQP